MAIAEGCDYSDIVAVSYLCSSSVPCVVMKDSGPASDLMFEYYLCGKEQRCENTFKVWHKLPVHFISLLPAVVILTTCIGDQFYQTNLSNFRYGVDVLFDQDVPKMIEEKAYWMSAGTAFLSELTVSGCKRIFYDYQHLRFAHLNDESELLAVATAFADNRSNLLGSLRLMMKLNNPDVFRQCLMKYNGSKNSRK